MNAIHNGRLQNVEDPTLDISVRLSFHKGTLHVVSDGRALGRWPLKDVRTTLGAGARHRLTIAGERWTFIADDAPEFRAFATRELVGPERHDLRERVLRFLIAFKTELSSFALVVATTSAAFVAGVLIGRYRLDSSRGVIAASIVLIAGLSLARQVVSSRLRPVPSVAVRTLNRQPSGVDRLLKNHRQAAPTVAVPPVRSLATTQSTSPLSDQEPSWAVSPWDDIGSPWVEPVTTEPEESGHAFDTARPGTPEADDAGAAEPEGSVAAPDTAVIEEDEASEREPTADSTDEPVVAAFDRLDYEVTNASLDLTRVTGIGPANAARLGELGVHNVYALAALDEGQTAQLAPQLDRYSSQLIDWVREARRLLRANEADGPPSLTYVRGIGPVLAARLVELEITNIYALAALDEDQTSDLASQLGRFGARLTKEDWVGQARRQLETDLLEE